jgi:hypothetical protein
MQLQCESSLSFGQAGISHPADCGHIFSANDTITLQTCQSPDVYTNKWYVPLNLSVHYFSHGLLQCTDGTTRMTLLSVPFKRSLQANRYWRKYICNIYAFLLYGSYSVHSSKNIYVKYLLRVCFYYYMHLLCTPAIKSRYNSQLHFISTV